ncbi:MAG TPA: alpha/beta fold hydrolase [Candidatus Binataceae bacterium]|nr:alpha/beta fold hydrolase [Candidatus Binataceae bacterium]
MLASVLLGGQLAVPASSAMDRGAASQTTEIAGLKVAVWIPDPKTPGPWPIVIFSHGFHGCATQSTFLTDAMAKAGYAVFAPDHKDAACGNLRAWRGRPEEPFSDPRSWDEKTYADRADDVEKLLNALSADPRYRTAQFDWNRIALAGHSLGGYTVMELAGAWPSRRDPRVKAVLALSPFSAPFILRKTLGGIDAPVMYQGGTWDTGITPFINKGDGAYAQTPAPKYFVEFDGAGHFAWTDLRAKYHRAIVDYSLAFLDHYLKGKPFPTELMKPHEGVSEVWIKQ